MESIERIKLMETCLDQAVSAINGLSDALEKYSEAKSAIQKLSEYLGSEEWFNDREADSAGNLPDDLKRGVLSEDGIWNALDDSRQLNIRMLEVATDFLKGN